MGHIIIGIVEGAQETSWYTDMHNNVMSHYCTACVSWNAQIL
jgi:hypothetical protein